MKHANLLDNFQKTIGPNSGHTKSLCTGSMGCRCGLFTLEEDVGQKRIISQQT